MSCFYKSKTKPDLDIIKSFSVKKKKMKKKYGSRYVEDRVKTSLFHLGNFKTNYSNEPKRTHRRHNDMFGLISSGLGSRPKKRSSSFDNVFGSGVSNSRKKNNSSFDSVFILGSSSRKRKKSNSHGFGSLGF